jgi:tyrosine-protein kinase Etk/Wzc
MKRNDNDIDTTPDNISLKSFFYKSVKYWYLFVVALVISYAFAYYKVRYNVPAYNVNARILIKDEGSTWSSESFMPGMELIKGRSKMVNEIGIIRSFPIMRKVIDDLPDYKVTYNDIGNIRITELYKESPFIVEWDSLNNSVYNRTFYIKMTSPDKFLISEQKFENDKGVEHSFKVPFKVDDNTLLVKLAQPFASNYVQKLYSFRINDMDDLAFSYLGNVGLNVEMKESSILIVSSSGTNVQKTIDFVNSLIKVYIKYGVEQASLTVTNTLSFVDQQLRNISDSPKMICNRSILI